MTQSPYQQLGGAEPVRRLVDRFYDLMDSQAQYRCIRRLHPSDLADSRDKLYMFLCGWLGGPNLYVERFGHPRLRARHLPFPIGTAERDAWIACMDRALADCAVEPGLHRHLIQALFQTADFMRNVEG